MTRSPPASHGVPPCAVLPTAGPEPPSLRLSLLMLSLMILSEVFGHVAFLIKNNFFSFKLGKNDTF